MFSNPLVTLFVVVSVLKVARCLPSGAPSCAVMIPAHDSIQPQDLETLPVSISARKLPNGSFQITIGRNSPNDEVFKGFRVMAMADPFIGWGKWFHVNGGKSKDVMDEDEIPCGVTHQNADPKKFVQLRYERPETEIEVTTDPVFEIVLVKDFATFWTDIRVEAADVDDVDNSDLANFGDTDTVNVVNFFNETMDDNDDDDDGKVEVENEFEDGDDDDEDDEEEDDDEEDDDDDNSLDPDMSK